MADEKQMSLDAVLDEKSVEAPPETPLSGKEAYKPTRLEHRDKEQEAQGRVRDPETGQYGPKKVEEPVKEPVKVEVPVKAPEKPLEEYTARERAAFAKAADETRKRQQAIQELQDARKQLTDLQKAQEKPFFEDPDGALARQKKELEDEIQKLRNEVAFAKTETRVGTSEFIARSRYPDYEEKINVFSELVRETPHLADQAFDSKDPSEFAYKTAKRHMDLEAAGGVEKMKEKMEADLRAKIKAEIEAEFKKREEDLKRDREALPGSLTDVPSKGINRPVWGGPPPLEDILKG